jgi:hypothetical protein
VRYSRSRAARFAVGLAAPLALAAPLLVGGITELAPASAATAAPCVSLTGGTPFVPSTTDNTFTGVTEISPCDVWAVGFDLSRGADETMTEHWNGIGWDEVISPSPGPNGSVLEDVRAISSNDVWAVGSFADSSGQQNTLALHWDGSQWSVVSTPNPPNTFSQLRAVRAVSTNDVWAVGSSFSNATGFQTLIEHWNGTQWSVMPSPNPGAPSNDNTLLGLAVTSANDAWAVGTSSTGTTDHTLILHWNGTSWIQVPSPTPDGSDQLRSVSATSASNAWAVGASSDGTKTVILRFNGTSWKPVTSPSSPGDNGLLGVAATSASNAWAVGFNHNGTLILAWNGNKWAKVASPAGDQLNSVVGVSASNAWAVGDALVSGARQPMAIHCC